MNIGRSNGKKVPASTSYHISACLKRIFAEKVRKKRLTTGKQGAIMIQQNEEGRRPVLTSSYAKRLNIDHDARKCAAFDAGAVGIRNFLSCKWRCFTIGKLDHELNEDIRDKEVRLIDAQGVMVGIVTSAAALAMAEEQELDLVKISPNAVPPVCKIMDYGKFRFDQLKREKEAKKNQRVVEIKEIRMSPSIDTNDLNTKMRNACKFLTDGNRVKVTVRFRGREMAHTDIGEQLLIRFAEGCAEVSSLEKKPKLDGRHMSIFLSPKNAK